MSQPSDIRFEYGKTQFMTSPRMRKRPAIGKLIYKIFGYTSVGNWARANVFIDRLRLLPLNNFKKIMDLGAGLGEFTFMMAEAMPNTQFTALEPDPERTVLLDEVVATRKYPNVKVFAGKIEELDENGVYDLIFSVDVFEHIKPAEMPFEECYKKLKPGGFILVKMPNVKQLTILPDKWFEEHNHWLEGEHVGQVLDLDGLTKRCEAAGFKMVHATYSDGWISRLGWELSYFTAKGGAIIQLLFLPVCKFIYYIEGWLYSGAKKGGNCIQVIGQK